eukprot:CAMPEP_0182890396 /NCGR_PEP_ID=MMETSP0034_2-20130328/22635_1 /TAXON_ID=156128 /ORGANISM="Nephroselmis pyriformis, Strain CCMP717" /LENGTH=203 /DNA_ID=CAMNT_0025023943 /DNA_START=298 /DNA_END=905 /DNA_ORIENTATION=-
MVKSEQMGKPTVSKKLARFFSADGKTKGDRKRADGTLESQGSGAGSGELADASKAAAGAALKSPGLDRARSKSRERLIAMSAPLRAEAEALRKAARAHTAEASKAALSSQARAVLLQAETEVGQACTLMEQATGENAVRAKHLMGEADQKMILARYKMNDVKPGLPEEARAVLDSAVEENESAYHLLVQAQAPPASPVPAPRL